MTFFGALYALLISPLELLFEFIFVMANRVLHNPGFSIVVLSMVMNFLVLPLYRQADEVQARERDTEAALEHWSRHIRKSFTGDERYMILQTYYRQNHYKPVYALRGTVSLLLEIPFFMAAYNMLSDMDLLKRVSFGPIANLGLPDGLLTLGGLTLNLLPILMTGINLITSAMYTKGFPLKSKIQLYAMAMIFLVLLYDSPSGLVLYWTLNNVFSLGKTLFYKLKHPRRVFNILSSLLGAAALLLITFVRRMPTLKSQLLMTGILLMMQLPMAATLIEKRFFSRRKVSITAMDHRLFLVSGIFLTLLVGVLIPSSLLQTSPAEFINLHTLTNPLVYLLKAALMAAGTFLVWSSVFYRLADNRGRKIMSVGFTLVSAVFFVDYMFFGKNFGMMKASLLYELPPVFLMRDQLINLAVVGILCLAVYGIVRFRPRFAKTVLAFFCAAVTLMSAVNIYAVHRGTTDLLSAIRGPMREEIRIPLSKKGKNVAVIMMDRAIGAYIPYLFAEKPELEQQFAGFTYYPNTISYGPSTNVGTPALFGGYEYRPEEMNRRDDMPLREKHNEALKVMPVLFSSQGYEVTVCDPSYAGYTWIPDLRIYEDHPEIHTFFTERAEGEQLENIYRFAEHGLLRNLFCYSLFKAVPGVIQPYIFREGTYNDPEILYPRAGTYMEQYCQSMEQGEGLYSRFMMCYQALQTLPQRMDIRDTEENTFLVISNEATHEPMLLQTPSYEPVQTVDNREYEQANRDRFTVNGRQMQVENLSQMEHYHVNMASMLQLGNWLDYLRREGVYDNTRIIIVADHGSAQHQFEDMLIDEDGDVLNFNPLLLVKDFNSHEFTVDESFMTQSDVPALATEGLIREPVNPFTGNPINMEGKQGPQHVFFTDKWNVGENNGNRFLPGIWYEVDGIAAGSQVLKGSSWKRIEDPSPAP